MKTKYLFLIDNDSEELIKLKEIVFEYAQNNEIDLITICTGEQENYVDYVVKKLLEVLDNNKETKHKLYLHVVVDACLTHYEEELSSIKKDNLSGVKCVQKISELLQKYDCSFHISLMSRFFAKQLRTYKPLQDFKDDKKNSFLTVIKKPILDNGTIDNGFSIMPDYVDILPQEQLTRKHVDAFKNILINVLK